MFTRVILARAGTAVLALSLAIGCNKSTTPASPAAPSGTPSATVTT